MDTSMLMGKRGGIIGAEHAPAAPGIRSGSLAAASASDPMRHAGAARAQGSLCCNGVASFFPVPLT